MFKTQEFKYYMQVFFATLIWGAAYPFTQYAVSKISPLSVVFLRSIFGGLFLFLFVRPKLSVFVKADLILKLLVISVFGVSLQQYIQSYALKYTTSINAGFIMPFTPVVIVMIEVILGERLSISKIFAFILGIIGTFIIIYSKGRFDFNLPSTKGDLIFLTSSFTWALYVVFTRRWFSGFLQKDVTAVTMLVAFITLIPFEVNNSLFGEIRNLDTFGWISLFYLCFLSSFIGYLFWNNAIEKLGPIKPSYFIYLQPFSSAVSAYIILGEKVSLLALVGGVLILLGVYIVIFDKK